MTIQPPPEPPTSVSIQYGYGPIGKVKRPRVTRDVPCRWPAGRVWTQRGYTTMAKRRKFLAGLGALASGSAAAVGTGAFTTSSSTRTMNVNVAADSSGFVEITALNSTYASGTSDGQLELDFNGDSSVTAFDGDGEGLNADSTFNFSEVFALRNIGQGDGYVAIEAVGFDLETLELTAAGTGNSLTEGKSLRAADYSDPDNLPKLLQPGSVNVDIKIETKDDSTTGAVGGDLIIHLANGNNRSELSDILS
jgi:hypothetical protein